jgi:hypothetical protein
VDHNADHEPTSVRQKGDWAFNPAAYLAQIFPNWGDGVIFLRWFMTWQDEYLKEKETTFQEVRVAKGRLGIAPIA